MSLIPHPSGALWSEAAKAVLIADAHLGYGWAQRRRGELGPVRDGQSGGKLTALIDELQPAEVVFLGDVVHAPRPGVEEREYIESTLAGVQQRAAVTVVRGNHDRTFARDFLNLGLSVVSEWRSAGVIGVHGDRALPQETGATVIAGHLHPSLTIEDHAGARHRVRVFLIGDGLIVLPAFSPFAAGYDLSRGLTPRMSELFRGRKMQTVAATGKRVVSLGPLQRFL